MTEDELKIIQKYYTKLSAPTPQEENLQKSYLIDGAEADHNFKEKLERELEARILPQYWLFINHFHICNGIISCR